MPCTSGCSSPEPTPHFQREIRQLRKMLCSALQLLEVNNIPVVGQNLERFWEDHKEEDRKRVEKEMREAKAKLEKAKKAKDMVGLLGRLSPYERSLLGAKFIKELGDE